MTDPLASTLSQMADDYAVFAKSQAASFARTYPTAIEAARSFSDLPELMVVDLGAADGVNSHELIRALERVREGRRLVYACVDLPSNVWSVSHAHLVREWATAYEAGQFAVLPAESTPNEHVVDAGTGVHFHNAHVHARAVGEQFAANPDVRTIVSHVGVPLHMGLCAPAGSVHIAVSGTTMHWVSDSGQLRSTGSVFPGYAHHIDEHERQAWAAAAARDWRQILAYRAQELAPGGVLVIAIPVAAQEGPARDGLYCEINRDMDDVLARWRQEGRIDARVHDAITVPVWMRTTDELEAPFITRDPLVDGLRLRHIEVFRLDNPYWDDDPAIFADRYVRSVAAWGGPLFRRAFALSYPDQADALLAAFLAELEECVRRDTDRYRWDYIEALVVCRKDHPADTPTQ